MCELCENLLNNESEIVWQSRSRYADDNLFETMELLNNYKIDNEYTWFELSAYELNGNTHVIIEYNHEIEGSRHNLKVKQFSESFVWNYCPMCGNRLGSTLEDYENRNYGIVVYDRNNK